MPLQGQEISCFFPPAEQCRVWKLELHQQRHAVLRQGRQHLLISATVDEIPTECHHWFSGTLQLLSWHRTLSISQHPLAGRVLRLRFRPWHKTLPHGFTFLCAGNMLIILYLVLQIYRSFISLTLSSFIFFHHPEICKMLQVCNPCDSSAKIGNCGHLWVRCRLEFYRFPQAESEEVHGCFTRWFSSQSHQPGSGRLYPDNLVWRICNIHPATLWVRLLEASPSSTLRESIRLHNTSWSPKLLQVLLASADFLQSFQELFPSRIELHHPSIVTKA